MGQKDLLSKCRINKIWNNITENYVKFSKQTFKDGLFVREMQQTD